MHTTDLDAELRKTLLAWDDSSEESRAASLARLNAIGSQAYTALADLTRRLTQRYNAVGVFMLGELILWFTLMVAVLALVGNKPTPPNDPYTMWLCDLLFGGAIFLIAQLFVLMALPTRLMAGAACAVGCYPPAQSLGLLLRLPASVSVTRSHKLLSLLKGITEQDAAAVTPDDLRYLRRLLNSPDSEMAQAVLHALTCVDDGTALPTVRRLAKRTRDWDTQEAANDYLRRFAPQEVTTRHRIVIPEVFGLDAPATHTNSLLTCVMCLGSRDATERQKAERALHAMQPEQLAQALLLLDREPPTGQRQSRLTLAACVLLGGLTGACSYFWAQHLPYYDVPMARAVAFACAIGGGAFGLLEGASLNDRRRNRQRARMLGCRSGIFPEKRLLALLASLDNVTLVGTILDHLPSTGVLSGSSTRTALQDALKRLLPRLQTSDAHLLQERHRHALNQELGRSKRALSDHWYIRSATERQADYDIAILKAWEQVGDEHALPLVQQLAALSLNSPAARRVKAAAEQCLPYLERRVGQQRQTQTLLRAADIPAASSDVLLRAATSRPTDSAGEQLLRSSYSNRSSCSNEKGGDSS